MTLNKIIIWILKEYVVKNEPDYHYNPKLLKLFIKYMVSNRSKLEVKEVLKKMNLHFIMIELGEVEIMESISADLIDKLKNELSQIGLELLDDKKAVLIEKVKNLIIDMVHYSDELIKVNYSVYIEEKLHHDYTYISNLFSEVQGITIAQFIILHKIEKAKELIIYDELNLTEISYKLHYSSVAHLSNQFKKVTGLTPSHFKQLKNKLRNSIEEIGNYTGSKATTDGKESET